MSYLVGFRFKYFSFRLDFGLPLNVISVFRYRLFETVFEASIGLAQVKLDQMHSFNVMFNIKN